MIDKVQKIREKVEKLKSQLLRGACSSQVAMETRCKEEAYNEVLAILDTMQEEPKAKFKVGDKVMPKRFKPEEAGLYLNEPERIIDIVGGYYILDHNQAYKIECQEHWELVEEPKSKFEQCIQEGDNIVYNEDLGCRVNLSLLERVAKKEEPKKCMYTKDHYTDEDRKDLCNGCEEECKFKPTTSVWHDESEEPNNKRNIVIWAEGFSNLIAVEEYRPEQKKFYYESGDHYYNVDITRKGLIWAYVDELLNLKKNGEPVNEDLDKAALEHANKQLREAGVTDENCPRELAVAQASLMVSGFKAGANWQKEQDKQWLAENHKHIFAKGRDSMKQQMMKEAVVGTTKFVGEGAEKMVKFVCANLNPDEYGLNQRVKLIIIRKD